MTKQVPVNFATNTTTTVSNTALTMTALGFDSDDLDVADQITLMVTGDAVRYRYDGVAPTATVGFYLGVNATPLVIEGNADIKRFQIIRVTGNAELLMSMEK